MPIFNSTDQYRYAGKGPLDAKALVAKYNKLTSESTWMTSVTNPNTGVESEVFTAYNGMIVAVWQDTDALNGIYFLHDPQVKTALAKPNVKETTNWHKMGGLGGLPGLENQINELKASMGIIEAAVSTLQQTTDNLGTDVETLRSEVESIKNQTPVFDVLDGGNAEG